MGNPFDPESYDYKVAMVIARNPRLICLDAVNIYDLVDGREVQVQDFSPNTIMVESFIMQLREEAEIRRGKPPFEVTPVLRVASASREKFPDAKTYLVDEFPVTENTVVRLMVSYLDMNGYFEKEESFIWGQNVLTKKEGVKYERKPGD